MTIVNLLPVVGELTLLSGFSRIFHIFPGYLSPLPPPARFCTIKSHIACFCPEPIYTKSPEQRGAKKLWSHYLSDIITTKQFTLIEFN